ncbi:MAG: hypothetical protein P8J33_13510 [Pirellulaceae bacterium]|nr:hypothetical protein [Pirellulaceae bacterium]
MSRDAITTPPKKIAGFKHNRITSSDGTDQETYALLWQDGTETEYSSFDDLPKRYKKIIRKLEKKAVNQEGMVPSRVKTTRRMPSRTQGGHRFRLRWKADPDNLVVCWPTLGQPSSWCPWIIILAAVCSIDFYKPFTFWSAYPALSLAVVITLAAVGILGFASAFLFEERFEIHPNRVTITRWPSCLKPAKVRPRKDVLNARIVLRRTHRNSRSTSSVYVRMRTPNGVEWWELGGGRMRRGNADSLGSVLSNYIDLDREDHTRDDLRLEIRF